MAQLFYDHLIVIEEVIAVLNEHNLTKEERAELLRLIDQTLHHEILDTIFTHLPKEHHETFLTRFHIAPHDAKLLEFLQEATSVDIEGEIFKTANRVKRHALSTIAKAKKETK